MLVYSQTGLEFIHTFLRFFSSQNWIERNTVFKAKIQI